MPDGSRRRGYGGRELAGDLSGGLVAALIALPYGLAMARLMGLPPALGLFTSILTGPITAALGRNPVLIGGTASATVPFLAAAVRAQGVGGSAKVVLAASVLMMAFGLLRLGRYAAKIPHAVVSGFSCGVGAMMIIVQLRTLLGLPALPGGSRDGVLGQLVQVVPRLGEARRESVCLGLITVVAALLASRRWPRSPAPLLGVALAASLARLLGWRGDVVGAIAPSFEFVAFAWEPADFVRVLPDALGLAVVASINVLITSRVVEHFQGRHRPLRGADADAELGAYGIANLCAGMFGAPMSVGIPARSLANVRCGGTTRLSNCAHSAALLALITFASPLIALIPLASLAGVTAFVGVGLLEWSTWRRLPRMRRVDALAFLATALGVVCADAITAVAIGCLVYLARFALDRLPRASRSAWLRKADA